MRAFWWSRKGFKGITLKPINLNAFRWSVVTWKKLRCALNDGVFVKGLGGDKGVMLEEKAIPQMLRINAEVKRLFWDRHYAKQ